MLPQRNPHVRPGVGRRQSRAAPEERVRVQHFPRCTRIGKRPGDTFHEDGNVSSAEPNDYRGTFNRRFSAQRLHTKMKEGIDNR
jgi:hypothetical protein